VKPTLAAALALGLLSCPARAALVVSNAPTSGVACVSGVCTATQADAVLNDKDFKHLIDAGDLTLVSGGMAQDIAFAAKVQWTGAHLLTLDAYGSILFALDATSEGGGGVTIITHDGGGSGALTFSGKGKLSFWDLKSKLVIDKHSYRLAGDIATLAADIAAKPTGHYALARGYDASVDGIYASAPIPTTFNGVFDGLGHAIDNLSIRPAKGQDGPGLGLFLSIGAPGRVRYLYLTNADVEYQVSTFSNTGAFAAVNSGSLENVSLASGKVVGGCAGGIAGENEGTISGASVSASSVSAGKDDTVGGLACINDGAITRSAVDADMGANYGSDAGGLVGDNAGTITLSHAAGQVYVAPPDRNFRPGTAAGGLAAYNDGTISQSYSTAFVTAGSCDGGEGDSNSAVAGGLFAGNSGTVVDSYAMGTTSTGGNGECNATAGGLIGDVEAGSVIARVYETGRVACSGCFGYSMGGLFGDDNQMTSQAAYWDLDTSGISDPSQGAGSPRNDPGVTGVSDTALKAALPAGFDPAVWAQDASINNGYPYLIANPPH
jgi:hypothetical protein